jgi:tetratricopeptide (TPR) repeat protein
MLPVRLKTMRSIKAKASLAFFICVLLLFSGVSNANIERPNVVKDLHYGEVLFHFYQEDYFTSIVHLLAARDLNRTSHHVPDDELLLGGIDLSYGLHKEASRIFDRLLQGNVRDAIKNRAYYYLAKIYYQRGYINEAADFLSNVSGPVQESIFGELKLLTGQVYIAQGKYNAAISSLEKWKAPRNYKNFANYNLGIAYTKSGNIDGGIDYLKKVSKQKAKTENALTLRDRANLASGLTLIQNDRPAEAIKYLEKVRVDGLYSNLALLGIGWANTSAKRYNSALAPLMELRNRSAYHSEVQEGGLALARAYYEMGLHGRAVQAYEQAADIYLAEAQELSKAAKEIERGALVDALLDRTKGGPQMGWFWTLRDLPELPEVKYFTELLAEHEFHEALKNFRDLLFLRKNLAYWDENISIYLTMLDTRKARYQKYLPLVQQRLNGLDLSKLQNQRDSLSFVLNEIENDNAFIQLATAEEMQKLAQIDQLEQRLELIKLREPENNKIVQMSEKIALMRGIMRWQIHNAYIERAWKNKQEISEIEKHLSVTPEKSASIKKAISESVEKFDEFEVRILALQKEIKRLIPIADRVFAEQSRYLEHVAVKELKHREKYLVGYEKHARYALASAYDAAASIPPGSTDTDLEESEVKKSKKWWKLW